MSLKVELDELAGQMQNFTFAYLLTTGEDQRPRAVGVIPTIDGAVLDLGDQGTRTVANASARPQVSLVWPPATAAGHSLIVDGEATISGTRLTVAVTSAVLHRPIE